MEKRSTLGYPRHGQDRQVPLPPRLKDDTPGAELVAVASRTSSLAQTGLLLTLSRKPSPRNSACTCTAFGSVTRRWPDDPMSVDLVYVATPHPQHAENALMVSACAGKGAAGRKNRSPMNLPRSRAGGHAGARNAPPVPDGGDVDAATCRPSRRCNACIDSPARSVKSQPGLSADFGFTASWSDPDHRALQSGTRRRRAARPRHLPAVDRGRICSAPWPCVKCAWR